jgi:rhodanese-related sulfurtransferase
MKMIVKNMIISTLFALTLFPVFGDDTDRAYANKLDSLYKYTVPLIQPDELYQRMQDEDIILLDTRKPDEYVVSRLPGARFVNYDRFKVKELADIEKDKTVVIYCSVGYRSERVGEKLQKKGYTNVYNLYGGLFEWSNRQLPLENNNGETSYVHGFSKEWGKWVQRGTVIYNSGDVK